MCNTYRAGPLTLDDGSSCTLDADRHIHDAYDLKDGAAVLVRPDSYIGAITSQPAVLAAYADRVMPSVSRTTPPRR
jgi:hypothetical protein